MPTHEVIISNPNKAVLRTDVEFVVRSDGKKLETLLLSKGNVECRPSGNSVSRHRISWERFATLMEEHPKRKRKS